MLILLSLCRWVWEQMYQINFSVKWGDILIIVPLLRLNDHTHTSYLILHSFCACCIWLRGSYKDLTLCICAVIECRNKWFVISERCAGIRNDLHFFQCCNMLLLLFWYINSATRKRSVWRGGLHLLVWSTQDQREIGNSCKAGECCNSEALLLCKDAQNIAKDAIYCFYVSTVGVV